MTNKLTILIAILFLVFSTSCEKEEAENSMTDEMAAEVIAKSIGSEAGGTNQQFIEAGKLMDTQKNVQKPSGTNTDFTVVYESVFGADIEYKYTFNYSYGLDLSNIAVPKFLLSYTADGFLNSEYLSSEDSGSGDYVIYESVNVAYYSINGNVNRKGTQTTTFGGTKTYTSNLDLVFTNLQSNKVTKQIDSGTATVSFTGAISTGEEFLFTGTITYNNDDTASLTIGDSTFTIDLFRSIVLAN